MGLDLVVEGCPRPGYEAEWRRLLERSFSGDETPEAERVRFGEISIPGYERIGAPRVGFDKTADDWIVESSNATPDEVPNVLKDFHGYYVLRLARCDGVPKYSNGGLYDGVDETSFRGDFLSDCAEVLSAGLIEEAWDHKFPEDAVRYGRGLLAAEAGDGFIAALDQSGGSTPKALKGYGIEEARVVERRGDVRPHPPDALADHHLALLRRRQGDRRDPVRADDGRRGRRQADARRR
jgi:hypothetical protein